MAETDTKKEEPKFTSTKVFDFKGLKRSVGIISAIIQKGKTANQIYYTVDPSKLSFNDIPEVWDAENVMEEAILPYIKKLCMATSKQVALKPEAHENNSLDNPFNWEQFSILFSDILRKFTLSPETKAALKAKSLAARTIMSEISTKFLNAGLKAKEAFTSINPDINGATDDASANAIILQTFIRIATEVGKIDNELLELNNKDDEEPEIKAA